MATYAGDIITRFGADLSGLSRGFSQAQSMGANFSSNMQRHTQTASSSFGGMAKSVLAAGAGLGGWLYVAKSAAQGAMGLGQALLGSSADMEQTAIAFKGLLGSGKAADAMMRQLQAFAASTPFEFPELAKDTQMLIGMGVASKDVIPWMTAIGDAAAGVGAGAEGVESVTRALGQMSAKGKVSGEEMMQLTEAGIPAWKILAQSMGLTVAQVQDLSQKGKLGGDAINKLVAGMEKAYGGQMANQAKTMNGLLSTLKDNAGAALRTFIGPLFEAAKNGLARLVTLTSSKAFSDFATMLGRNIGDALKTVTDVLRTAVSWFQTLWKRLEDTGALKDVMSIFSDLGSLLQESIGIALKLVASLFGDASEQAMSLQGSANKVADGLHTILGVIQKVTGWVRDIAGAFSDAGLGGQILRTILKDVALGFAAIKIAGLVIDIGKFAAGIATTGGKMLTFAGDCLRSGAAIVGMNLSINASLGIIGLLAVAIAGIILVVQNWNGIMDWFTGAYETKAKRIAAIKLSDGIKKDESEIKVYTGKIKTNLELMEQDKKIIATSADKDEVKRAQDHYAKLLTENDNYHKAINKDTKDATDKKQKLLDTAAGRELIAEQLHQISMANLEKGESRLQALKHIRALIQNEYTGGKDDAINTEENKQLGILDKQIAGQSQYNSDQAIYDDAALQAKQAANNDLVKEQETAWTRLSKGANDFQVSWNITWTEIWNGASNSLHIWARDSSVVFDKWSADAAVSFNKWSDDTATMIDQWILDNLVVTGGWQGMSWDIFNVWSDNTAKTFVTWSDNVGTTTSQWCADRLNDFSNWDQATGGQFQGWIGDRITDFSNWDQATGGQVRTWCADRLNDFSNWDQNTGALFQSWGQNIYNTITGWSDRARDSILSAFGQVRDSIGGIFRDIVNTMIDKMQGGINTIAGFINFFVDKINDVASGIGAGRPLSRVGSIGLPHLARGTQNFAGGPALVGEEGPEAVILPKGAAVLPYRQTKEMLGSGLDYIPRFAGGVGDAFGGILGWLTATIGEITGKIGDAFSGAPALPGVLSTLAPKIVEKFTGWMAEWVKKTIASLMTSFTGTLPAMQQGQFLLPPNLGFPGYAGHHGMDFGFPQGSPVTEIVGGTVSSHTGWEPWGGEVDVLIDGIRGMWERYLHLERILVSGGERVERGSLIGISGGGTPESGYPVWSNGPHLHVQYDWGDYGNFVPPLNVWAALGLFDPFMLSGAGTGPKGRNRAYKKGGVISEQIMGIGASSGKPYSFGERGMESVVPASAQERMAQALERIERLLTNDGRLTEYQVQQSLGRLLASGVR